MNGRKRITAFAVLAVLVGGVTASADDGDRVRELRDLEQEQAKLRDEVQALHKQLESLRIELLRAYADLKTVSQQKPNEPQARRRPPARRGNVDNRTYHVPVDDSPALGPAEAPVTIVEFGSYHCPFTALEHRKIVQMLNKYPDKVRFAFKHMPLESHAHAKLTHAAARLVQQKLGDDAFWRLHARLIAGGGQLDTPELRALVEAVGLDPADFDALANDSSRIDALVDNDIALARRCAVRGTPTVLINGKKLHTRSMSDYTQRLEELLAGSAPQDDVMKRTDNRR